MLRILKNFLPGYEGTDNMFYFFYKIITFRQRRKNDIPSACLYNFNFFRESVNSYNLETANHIAHIIFVFHSTPVRIHL